MYLSNKNPNANKLGDQLCRGRLTLGDQLFRGRLILLPPEIFITTLANVSQKRLQLKISKKILIRLMILNLIHAKKILKKIYVLIMLIILNPIHVNQSFECLTILGPAQQGS